MDQGKRISGVYTITCKVSGRVYVGSSTHVRGRWTTHRLWLRNGRHYILAMQADWDKYGKAAFEFRVIGESKDKAMRLAMEQAALDAAWESGVAYNHSRSGEGGRFERSAETRKLMSESGKLRWADTEITPEMREHMAAIGRAGKGRPKSPEQCAKIAEAQKRAWAARSPEEIRERMAKMGRGNLGRPKSAAQRANMAKARRRLTAEQVSEIRERYAAGNVTQGVLAAEFGVHHTTISNVVRSRGYAA